MSGRGGGGGSKGPAPAEAATAAVTEVPAGELLGFASEAFRVHPTWREAFPWLIQGITASRGLPDSGDGAGNLRLFGPAPSETALERWEGLRRRSGMTRLVVARQVHGSAVALHEDPGPGLLILHGLDGHAARLPGILLAVTVADCVPAYLVHAGTGARPGPAVALIHAGWRGIADGVLEEAVELLEDRLAISPGDLRLHLGPAICGACYEVGPEVHRALGLPDPGGPEPVDLRTVLADRARGLGLAPAAISRSSFCTRCDDAPFFSHRRGDEGREAALLGIRWPGSSPGPVGGG